MKNRMDNKQIVALALTGAAVGVAAWFLFKTTKGKGIGKELIGSVKNKVADRFGDFSGQTGKMIKELKTKANNSVNVPA